MSADKNIVMSSCSLRVSRVIRSSATNNDVLRASSLRVAQKAGRTTTNNDVLNGVSLPISGFVHSGGQWSNPEDMSYVTIHM